MPDVATPDLPARDFDATAAFYGALGFAVTWRDPQWMILSRGAMTLEFFLHPDLNPTASWFSCCLRLDDLAGFYAACRDAGLAQAETGWPRLHPPRRMDWGGEMAALIDLDGTLLRLIGLMRRRSGGTGGLARSKASSQRASQANG